MTSLHQEVCDRIHYLLDLSPNDINLALSLIETFHLILRAKTEQGNTDLERLADYPGILCRVSKLAPIHDVHLYKQGYDEPMVFFLADQSHESTAVYEVNPMPQSAPAPELIELIAPFADAVEASLFVLGYDGTYLEYLECGHKGPTIVGYDEMIGSKAMEKLPEPLRSTCKHYHHMAIESGQPQRYHYTSPSTGRRMFSAAIPYPQYRQVVLLVRDELAPVLVTA